MVMLSVYAQSGTHRRFHWRIITILTQNPTVLMFVDITGAPKLWRKYAETWVFVSVSEQWPLGGNIWGSCYFVQNTKYNLKKKCIWKCLQHGGHFVPVPCVKGLQHQAQLQSRCARVQFSSCVVIEKIEWIVNTWRPTRNDLQFTNDFFKWTFLNENHGILN